MRRMVPVIIQTNGERSVASFPVHLEPGDEFILTQEVSGSKVPDGQTWEVNGYTNNGPIMSVTEERNES